MTTNHGSSPDPTGGPNRGPKIGPPTGPDVSADRSRSPQPNPTLRSRLAPTAHLLLEIYTWAALAVGLITAVSFLAIDEILLGCLAMALVVVSSVTLTLFYKRAGRMRRRKGRRQ